MGDVPSEKTADGTAPVSEQGASPASARPNVRHHSSFAEARYGTASSPLNMGMGYSLPGHSQGSPYDQSMHQYPAAHGQGMMYPMPMPPYGHNSGMTYGMPYPAYPPYVIPQHGTHYQPHGTQMQNLSPGQISPYASGYYPPSPYGTPYGHGVPTGQMPQASPPVRATSSSPSKPGSLRKEADKRMVELEYDVSKTIVDGSNPMKSVPQPLSDNISSLQPAPTAPSTPRGPPRKPKQSGHALWVGNLPPGANVMDLKDHFSQDATNDIESVFLISKSNCAFVNYKSAAACVSALARFHDSRFQGVRVVCRLRKGFTAPGSGSVGVAGPMVNHAPRRLDDISTATATAMTTTNPGEEHTITPELSSAAPATGNYPPPARLVDRYFIVKSLTVEDLELSKQSGIWATQSHNEAAMNQAFETTDYVYLIFSANKSGEYFGYARMMSPISDDEELALEMPSRPDPPPGPDDLEVTLTAATSTAPQGRIIDDSVRGTIFWEVESSEDENNAANEKTMEKNMEKIVEKSVEKSVEKTLEPEDPEEGQTFGKPFRIQWISTERVPFQRTRGLRNPWNANREIKIARDGTEIEPTIGRKLIQLFHIP
ncbi:Nucleotide-binding alpha-beta plait [Penicillium concentricum]|uniref:Nucleotide-binding alpha-beta plait n=1 Tax=Penicillium concentricum TaxID=293559 RepID=A0A9W9S693_9EURO|nr:Nucleotide-binding alpha-beta plait [Penicillium concentricum]KAJ5372105.1 Nucleotide-binding alpha-beta plait [Penicillium concentricum]